MCCSSSWFILNLEIAAIKLNLLQPSSFYVFSFTKNASIASKWELEKQPQVATCTVACAVAVAGSFWFNLEFYKNVLPLRQGIFFAARIVAPPKAFRSVA